MLGNIPAIGVKISAFLFGCNFPHLNSSHQTEKPIQDKKIILLLVVAAETCLRQCQTSMLRSSCPEMFCKKVFLKIRKIHRKTTVPESLFNRVAGLRPATL